MTKPPPPFNHGDPTDGAGRGTWIDRAHARSPRPRMIAVALPVPDPGAICKLAAITEASE